VLQTPTQQQASPWPQSSVETGRSDQTMTTWPLSDTERGPPLPEDCG
jgi:hypothetical protein